MDNHLRHIVLFKLYENTTPVQQQEALNLLHKLGADNSNLLEWTITKSLDTRKGIILIENGLFADEDAYLEFQKSDKHFKVADYMKNIADWVVGNYIEG